MGQASAVIPLMKLSEVLCALGAPPDSNLKLQELLAPHWETSVATLPHDWQQLHRETWQKWREWCSCPPEIDAALESVVEKLNAQPALRLLAWHCQQLVFEHEDYTKFREWPILSPLLESIEPAYRDAFFLFISLGAAPRLRKRNEERGIPEKITRDTLRDIAIVTERHTRYNPGKFGCQPRLYTWHRLVASGDLFCIGRFEYIMRAFRGRLRAYRHRETKRVIALSEADVGYNQEGHFPLEGEAPAWKSTFEEDAEVLRGHLVSPRGFAVAEPIELPAAEWEKVLSPGDSILEIHIPEGEALAEELCRDSFVQAREFFHEHLQETSPQAFACYSWILNTQFEMMLRPSSNLLAWQRELSLFPVPSTGRDGLYFVFYQDEIDPATAPQDTFLRRAFVNHLAQGHALRSGGMFFLFDDLPHYGKQFYREGAQPLGL